MFLLVFFFLFVSCTNKKKKLVGSVEEIMGHELVIPYSSLILCNNVNDEETEYKLIIYSDTSECSFCNVKNTFYWEALLDSVNSGFTEPQMNITFIYSPPKLEQERFIYNVQALKLPWKVYVDTCLAFQHSNPQIPQNGELHAFLINKKHEVLAVGNPLNNERIEKLLIKMIRRKR